MGVESIDLNEVDCDSARRGFELLSLLNDLLPSRSNLRLRTTTSSIIHHLDWQSSENAVSRGIAPGGLGTFLRVARHPPRSTR